MWVAVRIMLPLAGAEMKFIQTGYLPDYSPGEELYNKFYQKYRWALKGEIPTPSSFGDSF